MSFRNPFSLAEHVRRVQQFSGGGSGGGNPPPPPPSSPAIIGKRTPMSSRLNGGGTYDLLPTQLISARVSEPKEWIVTLPTITPSKPGVVPWPGTETPTTSTAGYKWPLGAPYQVGLRWGAGGASFETQFDMPERGVSFGVVADTFDLNMFIAPWFAIVAATPDDIPMVGAFMVQGHCPDPAPLRWWDQSSLGAAVGDDLYFAYRPFAKRVEVNVFGAGASSYAVRVGGMMVQRTGDIRETFDCGGSGSRTLHLEKLAGADTPTVVASWHIGLT